MDTPTTKRIRVCTLINRAKVKDFALTMIRETRPQFTIVSKEFTDRAEAALKNWIRAEMHRHPSKGVTIK
jgi:hypothetical protein